MQNLLMTGVSGKWKDQGEWESTVPLQDKFDFYEQELFPLLSVLLNFQSCKTAQSNERWKLL